VGIPVLVLAIAAAGTWIARYDPLAPGSFGYAPPKGVRAQVIDVSYALGDVPRIFRIPAATGMTFRYPFSIWNDGPVSVTIDDIGTFGTHSDFIVTRRPVRVQVDPHEGPTGSPWIAFHPFTLAPEHEAAIEMEAAVHRGCIDPGSSMSLVSEDVTYSVFGVTRHVDFTPDVAIVLIGTPASCGH
jgi:hypothetical protein